MIFVNPWNGSARRGQPKMFETNRSTCHTGWHTAVESLEARQLLSAGQLDPSFGTGGEVRNGQLAPALHVAVQTDGKIVTLGMAGGSYQIVRYKTDGSLDGTFGSNGIVTTNDGTSDLPTSGIAVAPDGKIVFVGTSADHHFTVERLNPDGLPDTTFNGGNYQHVSFGFNDVPKFITVGTSGDVYVGGDLSSKSFPANIGIAHLKADGALDTGFATGGEFIGGGLGATLVLEGLAVQPDGKLVYATTYFGGNTSTASITRLTASGQPDGTQFPRIAGTGYSIRSAIVDASGRIVDVGQLGSGGPFLTRYNMDGTTDTPFGTAGTVYTTDPNFSYVGVVEQSDRHLVVEVQKGTTLSLIRYNANGSLDTAFGNGGTVATDIVASSTAFPAMALAPASKLVLAGQFGSGQIVERYNLTGTVDTPLPTGGNPGGTGGNPAGTAPTALLYQGLRLRSSQKAYSFVVAYSNGGSAKNVDTRTIDNNDVIVTGPGGYTQFGQKLLVQSLKRGFLVTYVVPAPSHRWDASDNGVYTISINSGQIASNDGAFTSAGNVGQFAVIIPAVTPATVRAAGRAPFTSTLRRKSSDAVFA